MAETGDDNYEDDGQKQDNKGGSCSLDDLAHRGASGCELLVEGGVGLADLKGHCKNASSLEQRVKALARA